MTAAMNSGTPLPMWLWTVCRKEILFAIDHFNQIVRHELLRMISWKVGIETGFKLSVGKNYKFIERYIRDLWEKLLSTYRMDSYENIWEALFLCHQVADEALWRSVGLPIPEFVMLDASSNFAAVEAQLALPSNRRAKVRRSA